jgi:hypothetical protein
MDFTQPGSGRPRTRRKNHVIFQSMEAAGVLAHLSDLQGKPKGVPDMAAICRRKRPAAEMEELYSTLGYKAGEARKLAEPRAGDPDNEDAGNGGDRSKKVATEKPRQIDISSEDDHNNPLEESSGDDEDEEDEDEEDVIPDKVAAPEQVQENSSGDDEDEDGDDVIPDKVAAAEQVEENSSGDDEDEDEEVVFPDKAVAAEQVEKNSSGDEEDGEEDEEDVIPDKVAAAEQVEKNSSGDDEDEEDDVVDDEDEYTPGDDSDHSEPTVLAKARAGRLIPTSSKQTKSAVSQLHTNGLDPPKFNRCHKAQYPVSINAPGFREASEQVTIPAKLTYLYNNCLKSTKEAFFISALSHIQVIATICGLSTEDIIKMRGWVFLRKKSSKGPHYRYQTFADAVYEIVKRGGDGHTNFVNLVYRFDEVLKKMYTEHGKLTSGFPSPINVLSRKKSKRKGSTDEPLIKHYRGVSIDEKYKLGVENYGVKIRKYFEKYQLGVCAVHIIFSEDSPSSADTEPYFALCDQLFHHCITEKGYIFTLHDALRVFYGPYSISTDGKLKKQAWKLQPSLFQEQLKLLGGKPGVLSLERYEEEVQGKYDHLIGAVLGSTEKPEEELTMSDNAILIRYRVMRFKRSLEQKVNTGRKGKKSLAKDVSSKTSIETPTRPPDNPSATTPSTRVRSKDSPGFFGLLEAREGVKESAASDLCDRKRRLDFVSSGRRVDPAEEKGTTALPALPAIPAPGLRKNTKIAIEDDPGPFESAKPENVQQFGPVLVIVPDDGSIDYVMVELSPFDVYYREKLRVDNHSMTYLSLLPSFDEMKDQGFTFQFYSSKKDYVSDSFAILRGLSNPIVASVIMDSTIPDFHDFKALFELLGRHGELQPSRDDGNKTGAGYRIDLGACDHSFSGENLSGLGPTPKTNGGFKCFEKTGHAEKDARLPELRAYFASMADAVQSIVDKVRHKHGFTRIFDDILREEAYAVPFRNLLGAETSRAEEGSNFATALDGTDGCSWHRDDLNCSMDSYDFTCCAATTVASQSTGRLYRVVTNLNSRAACGRATASESKHAPFKNKLKKEMERINLSYEEVYGTGRNEPTATAFTNLYLSDSLTWGDENRIVVASAPSRDFFLSAAASAICNLRQAGGLGCHTLVGLLLIAIYMSSYEQLHTIMRTIKEDPKRLERIKTDLPGAYWDASVGIFEKFWGGAPARFAPSGFDFKETFVDNKPKFELAVVQLKELLKLVNTSSEAEAAAVTRKIKEMADSVQLPYLNVFRLQLFIPLAALCGLVLPDHLCHADYIEPSDSVENGSLSTLMNAGFPMHRHSDTLLNICGQVGLPRRLSLGEGLACESHRRLKRFDLFIHSQDLFHLFLKDTGYLVQVKRFNSKIWEPIAVIDLEVMRLDDCA